MPSQMINLKQPKQNKKSDSAEPVAYHEDYPYGTQLSFDEPIINKIKVLEEIGSGTKVKIDALAFISEVSTSEYAGAIEASKEDDTEDEYAKSNDKP